MVVEEGKVREFARATKSNHPDHVREVDPVSPVAFLMSSAFWQGPEADVWGGVERDFSRILHGEQEFTFQGPPPRAGTELAGVSRIVDVSEKHGTRGGLMTFTKVVTEFRDLCGELVAEVTKTTILTSRTPKGGEEMTTLLGAFDPSGLKVGQTLPSFTDQPLTVTDFVRYQGASGDMNPIHHDAAFAMRSGFPSLFAVGMLTAGIFGSFVTDRFGSESVRHFRVQFREQAWPGDVLTYGGAVSGIREADGVRLADLELTCTRQTEGAHLRAWSTVVLD